MNKSIANQVEDIILDHFEEGFYDFMEDFKDPIVLKKAGIEFVEDLSSGTYDSYGYSYIDHKIIFKHIETGQHIALVGDHQSYNGTDWDGFINIEKKEKVIEVWEKIN